MSRAGDGVIDLDLYPNVLGSWCREFMWSRRLVGTRTSLYPLQVADEMEIEDDRTVIYR